MEEIREPRNQRIEIIKKIVKGDEQAVGFMVFGTWLPDLRRRRVELGIRMVVMIMDGGLR